MNYIIDIQNATEIPLPFAEETLTGFALLPLKVHLEKAELTIRFVLPEEIRSLNATYRHQDKVTNVLAFPSQLPSQVKLDYPFLGDVLICPAVLLKESQALNKSLQEHWALILIHGILHLLGYDHLEEDDTTLMQGLEIKLLKELGYTNPYTTKDNSLD